MLWPLMPFQLKLRPHNQIPKRNIHNLINIDNRRMYQINIGNVLGVSIGEFEDGIGGIELEPTDRVLDVVLLDDLLEELVVELLLLLLELLGGKCSLVSLRGDVFCVLHILLCEHVPVLVGFVTLWVLALNA